MLSAKSTGNSSRKKTNDCYFIATARRASAQGGNPTGPHTAHLFQEETHHNLGKIKANQIESGGGSSNVKAKTSERDQPSGAARKRGLLKVS